MKAEHLRCALLLLITGCELDSSVEAQCVIDPAQRERAAQFVVDCARAGNPMSDEEGEDLVAQCERTAAKLFCQRRVRFWRDGWHDCELAESEKTRNRCEALRLAYSVGVE